MTLKEIEKRFYRDHYKKTFKYSGIMEFVQNEGQFLVVLSDGTPFTLTGCEPGKTIQVKEGFSNLIKHCRQIAENGPIPAAKAISLSTIKDTDLVSIREMAFKSCPPLKRIRNILCVEQSKKKTYLRVGTQKVTFRQEQGIDSYYAFFPCLLASLEEEMKQELPKKFSPGTQLESIRVVGGSNIILNIKIKSITCGIQLKISSYSLKDWTLEEAVSKWVLTNVSVEKELEQKLDQAADKASKKYTGKLGDETKILSQNLLDVWDDFTGKRIRQIDKGEYDINSLKVNYRGLNHTIDLVDGSITTVLNSEMQKLVSFYNNRCKYRKIAANAERIAKKSDALCKMKLYGNKAEKEVKINFHSKSQDYVWNHQVICSPETGLDPETEKCVLEKKDHAERKWNEQFQSIASDMESKWYYRSVLARDCISIVRQYEKFITLSTIVSLLRGTKIKSSLSYETKYYGKYNFLPQNMVENFVEKLALPGENILEKKLVKGTYDSYYIYKLGDPLKIKLLMNAKPLAYKKGKFLSSYSCLDWIKVLDALSPESMSEKDWEGFLEILNTPEVLCVDPRVKKFFQKAPASVQECLRCLYKLENEPYKKKIIKYLLN